ncbi:MAG: hypothetical protein ACRCY4_00645 [Brevinema sp.]
MYNNKVKYLLFLLSILVFILWFSKGFNFHINTDMMKESLNMIDFRFPQMLFSEISMSGNGIWHRSRWSANIMGAIPVNVIAPAISFFTGDKLSAIYIGVGMSYAVMFLSLTWILSIFVAITKHIAIFSLKFIRIFVISTFFTLFLYYRLELLQNVPFNFFLPIEGIVPQFIGNYIWSIVLVMGALLPYWIFLFQDKATWRENSSQRFFWLFLCILAAFSSIGATVLLGFGVVFFSLLILKKIQSFKKIWDLFGKDTIFIIALLMISLLAELIFGLNAGAVKSFGLKLDLLLVFFKSIAGFLLLICVINVIPLLSILLKTKQLPKNLCLSVLVYSVIGVVYIFFFAFLSGRSYAPMVYQGPVSIMILAISTTIWCYFLETFPSLYIQSIGLFVVISHVIAFIPVHNHYKYKILVNDKINRIVAESQKENVTSIDLQEFWPDDPNYANLHQTIVGNWLHHTKLVDQNISFIVADPPKK